MFTLCKKIPFKIGIARIFNITGKNQQRGYFVPDIINKIKFQKKIMNINKYRDFVHIDDVVKALNLMVKKKYDSQINISSGKKVTLIEICKKINKIYYNKKISFDINRGKDIFGNNNKLKKLGLKKFKDIQKIISSLK